MWLPASVLDWFTSLKEDSRDNRKLAEATLELLKEDLSQTKQELAAANAQLLNYAHQASRDNANIDWLKASINRLEMERGAYLKKHENLDVDVPQFEQSPAPPDRSGFEDIGDELARKLGMTLYDET